MDNILVPAEVKGFRCGSSGVDQTTGWKTRCNEPATKLLTIMTENLGSGKREVSVKRLCSKHAKILRNRINYQVKHCGKRKSFVQIDLEPEPVKNR